MVRNIAAGSKTAALIDECTITFGGRKIYELRSSLEKR